jgi:hypothetical protein
MHDQTQQPTNLPPPPPPIGVPGASEAETLDEEELAKQELARITPSNEKLRELARKCPPPPWYFEGDEEMPFDPVEE